MDNSWLGKSVLITGVCGTVGKELLRQIIAKNPDNVAKFKAGNTKLLGFFVGQVLKTTGGKANPVVVNELVAKKLGE